MSKSQDILKKNHVTIAGNLRSDKTMMFVHGFGTDQSAWRSVTPAFSNEYRLVLLDNVGANGADTDVFVPHRYQTLDKYADDLLDICDVMNVRDAILVGHSLGGMISILAGIRSPAYFSKIAVIGASPCYLNMNGYYGGLTHNDILDIYAAVQHNHWEWASSFAQMSMKNPDKPDLANEFAETLRKIPTARVLTVLQTIFQTDYREEISKLNIPTLIIQSQEDDFVPMQVAEFIHEKINGSKLEIIETIGHLPHITAPQKVISALARFI